MSIKVIGAGLGRTGTYSLKLALERLGFGPCYHMEEVAKDIGAKVPLWVTAAEGRPDWKTIFDGYTSTVDWPTASFFRELHAAYPEAKFILTHRSPVSWAESFGATIQKLISEPGDAPPELLAWHAMGRRVIERAGIGLDHDHHGLVTGFNRHMAAVREAIPAEQLLVYQVRQGWEPLCAFLGVEMPNEPFPRSNNRSEFWDLVSGATD